MTQRRQREWEQLRINREIVQALHFDEHLRRCQFATALVSDALMSDDCVRHNSALAAHINAHEMAVLVDQETPPPPPPPQLIKDQVGSPPARSSTPAASSL